MDGGARVSLVDLATASALVGLAVLTIVGTDWAGLPLRSPTVDHVALPKQPIALVGQIAGTIRGSTVGVVEFADFRCPFCGAFARNVQPELMKRYVASGQVVWVFRNLPLTALHPLARVEAELAQCAGVQGRFWQAHDLLFDHQTGTALSAQTVAGLLGLNPGEMKSCLAGPVTPVDDDLREADRLGVRLTPTFFVGTVQGNQLLVREVLTGATTKERFRSVIEAAIKRSR
jgi:protein-disulfide isomerase